MRRLLLCGVSAAMLMAGSRHACAFEIVEDIAAEVGISKQLVEEIKNGLTQLKQLQTELQELQADLQLVEQFTFLTESFVHNPNLGSVMGLLNALGLQNDLPLNPFAVQSLLSGYGGMSGLNGVLGQLSNLGNLVNGSFNADHLFDCTDNSFACQQTKARAAANAGYKGIASQLYTDLTNHMTSLGGAADDAARGERSEDRGGRDGADRAGTYLGIQHGGAAAGGHSARAGPAAGERTAGRREAQRRLCRLYPGRAALRESRMRYLYQALYALTLISAGAAGSYVWLRQVQPQLALASHRSPGTGRTPTRCSATILGAATILASTTRTAPRQPRRSCRPTSTPS